MIKLELTHPLAKVPTRGSEGAAGLDISIVESVDIPPGKSAILSTGIRVAIPEGHVGLLWPRSKLSAKLGADVLAGVIDSDYRGEIKAAILNTSDKTLELKVGDKVVQMVIQKHYSDMPISVVPYLPETERGDKGINSTEMRIR